MIWLLSTQNFSHNCVSVYQCLYSNVRVTLQSIHAHPEDEEDSQPERSRLRGVTFTKCSEGPADGRVREWQERKEGWWRGGLKKEEEEEDEEGWSRAYQCAAAVTRESCFLEQGEGREEEAEPDFPSNTPSLLKPWAQLTVPGLSLSLDLQCGIHTFLNLLLGQPSRIPLLNIWGLPWWAVSWQLPIPGGLTHNFLGGICTFGK